MTSLAMNLKDAAGQYPDRPAVRLGDEVLSYAELDDRTAQVAGWLRQRGLGPGDRVGIMLPNVLAFPVLYYGVLRAGGVIIGCLPMFHAFGQTCGLSETSPVASFNRLDGSRPGSIGYPVDGVDMKLVAEDGSEVPSGEVGEIAICGHNVMKGYRNRPEATAEAVKDGWFHSGDLARKDEDGFYFIVDRKKDLIIRGGFNVYPREIEEVLYEHPAVLEAAVIGLPHPTHGEEVAAAVALKPGCEATPGELRGYVKERVASYKYPRRVWLVDALPKGPTGKILKREVHPPEDAP